MRIIKEDKLPLKEKKMECKNCGCVFMYNHRVFVLESVLCRILDLLEDKKAGLIISLLLYSVTFFVWCF